MNFLNGIVDPQTDLLARYIANGYAVMTCPVVVQEVLQGIRDERQFQAVQQSLLGFDQLHWQPYEAALAASVLYRNLRNRGVTIRKSNDCLIAAFALHFSISLLHTDSDFDLIAAHTDLKILVPAL